MVLEATGNYLYVTNQGAGNISAYALDSITGVPTQIVSSPFAASADAVIHGSGPV